MEGKRATFIATFSRNDVFETRWGSRAKALLKDIQDVHFNPVTDHLSITDPDSLQLMAFLKEGDLIVFNAGVRKYRKGYPGDDIDSRLKHPESFDYTLCDVRDLVKQNLDTPIKRISGDLGLKELMMNKRIAFGVA
ncbi:MAG: hypothetical protein WCX22_06075 [Methanoregula sp.]